MAKITWYGRSTFENQSGVAYGMMVVNSGYLAISDLDGGRRLSLSFDNVLDTKNFGELGTQAFMNARNSGEVAIMNMRVEIDPEGAILFNRSTGEIIGRKVSDTRQFLAIHVPEKKLKAEVKMEM